MPWLWDFTRKIATAITSSAMVEVAVKVDGVSTMADDVMAVAIFLVKSQSHGIQFGMKARLARVHLPCNFRAEDLSFLEFAVLKMGNHEMRDVGSGDGKSSCRSSLHDFEAFRFVRA